MVACPEKLTRIGQHGQYRADTRSGVEYKSRWGGRICKMGGKDLYNSDQMKWGWNGGKGVDLETRNCRLI